MITKAPRLRARAGSVVIDLPRPTRDALIALAIREDRDIVGQARRLITDALAREGLITEREA